ncbi:MAG TPA: serine O-acetyltransferase [Candidatus Bathyarchaeia archaeon]|nr:serine O-acetyltransferase [Candidatus Bathyarchaeia archaeon]
MWGQLKEDIQVVFERDPAARSKLEVVLTYSGLHAIWAHRVAHKLFKAGWFTSARIVSQVAKFFTGIEIHPGATIGKRLFIDHGMGVVIGETCEIGDDVTVFQGVTLGGTGKEKGKRHPTVGNNVIIATGAKVLGSFKIGDNAKIGAGAIVLQEVPPNSTVVGIKGRVVIQDGKRVKCDLDHVNVPDPVADILRDLQREVNQLRQEVQELRATREEQKRNEHSIV